MPESFDELDRAAARLAALEEQLAAAYEEQARWIAVEAFTVDERAPEPWEVCACGAPAAVVYVTMPFGDVPWCAPAER